MLSIFTFIFVFRARSASGMIASKGRCGQFSDGTNGGVGGEDGIMEGLSVGELIRKMRSDFL